MWMDKEASCLVTIWINKVCLDCTTIYILLLKMWITYGNGAYKRSWKKQVETRYHYNTNKDNAYSLLKFQENWSHWVTEVDLV